MKAKTATQEDLFWGKPRISLSGYYAQFEEKYSTSERLWAFWLMEAEDLGFISDVEYQPPAFSLTDSYKHTIEIHTFTPKKHLPKTIQRKLFSLGAHTYTADWRFTISRNFLQKELICEFDSNIPEEDPYTGVCWVDTKAADYRVRQRFESDATFPLNQKWVFQAYGVYVNKVVPKKRFKKLWAPDGFRITPKKLEISTQAQGCPSVTEFLAAYLLRPDLPEDLKIRAQEFRHPGIQREIVKKIGAATDRVTHLLTEGRKRTTPGA